MVQPRVIRIKVRPRWKRVLRAPLLAWRSYRLLREKGATRRAAWDISLGVMQLTTARVGVLEIPLGERKRDDAATVH